MIEGKKYLTPLDRFIEESGLKKNWIAEKIGITTVTLRDYRRGNYVPDLIVAYKLAKLLKVEMEELVDESKVDLSFLK